MQLMVEHYFKKGCSRLFYLWNTQQPICNLNHLLTINRLFLQNPW